MAKIVTASSPPCGEEDRDEEQADDCYGHALHRTFVSRLVLDSVSAVLSYVLSGASRGSGFPQPGNSRLRPVGFGRHRTSTVVPPRNRKALHRPNQPGSYRPRTKRLTPERAAELSRGHWGRGQGRLHVRLPRPTTNAAGSLLKLFSVETP